jgi:hypothetical protein
MIVFPTLGYPYCRLTSFQTALTWPEAQHRIQALLERGLPPDIDFANRWAEVLGTLVET